MVVFPELSLTGYELDADAVAVDDVRSAPIMDACAATGSLALVGVPVVEGEWAFIAMLRVDAAGVQVAYRKSWLGGSEPARFTPGADSRSSTGQDRHFWGAGRSPCPQRCENRATYR